MPSVLEYIKEFLEEFVKVKRKKLKNKLEDFIEKCKKLNVLVIGETIIDRFIKVKYEGQSMKSFCPVFRYMEADEQILDQQGGAAAIAGHLKSFVGNLDFVSNTNNEIVKTRLIDFDGGNKHVEINRIDSHTFKEQKVDTAKYDVVIVADFGHGFCDKLEINDGFHLMSQTNSNNFGFNRLSKWKWLRKKSICLDLREASLQLNKKLKQCTFNNAMEIYEYEMNCEDLFITVGKKGAVYTNGKNFVEKESFESKVVDTIGAGDAFYSFACISSFLNLPYEDKLLIPSLAGSLSTTWLCNEKSITPEMLLKHANRFL